MLYLTLEDDPFSTQEHDEDVLLELVRTVARRNSDDRTVSELIRLRDSLDRLGLLWTPLDVLDKYQSIEFVRNLHLELAAPGDMIYLNEAPAMRSYVLLRGAVLLSPNVLDREGNEGTRLLVPGNEFGAHLDPDLDPDQPVDGFEEYAKAPHIDATGNSIGTDSNAVSTGLGGGRKDGRAELLVIGRQDWISTIKCSRTKFAEIVSKDSAGKEPDDLKKKARVAFNFPAKGRGEEHLAIARQYLTERVPFCSDLPEEPLSALAAALEIHGLTVPRRTIFRRGRECFGEAYIMFTGSADQKGGERSDDRLIKEGDMFGDDHFGVGGGHNQDAAAPRTATVLSRMAPCELLVLPARECRRLQAFVAVRNSEKAKVIFENFFHNMPRDTSSELSLIAKIRKINMNARLASEGDVVTAVFFVFRGECLAKSYSGRGEKEERRYGPGEIIGWSCLMPTKPVARPASTSGTRGPAGANKAGSVDAVGRSNVPKPANRLRPRADGKEWLDTITVSTPAQVLQISVVGLLESLSEEALQGLRSYISRIHKAKTDEEDIVTASLAGADESWGEGGAGGSAACLEGFHMAGLLGQSGGPSKGTRRRAKSSGNLKRIFGDRPESAAWAPSPRERRRLHTTPGKPEATSYRNPWQYEPRPNSRTNWRWRVDLTNPDRASRGGSRQKFPAARAAVWDSGEQTGRVRRKLCGCACPVERCRVCLSTPRLNRFHQTPAWVPSLPPRVSMLSSASAPVVGPAGSQSPASKELPHVPATSALHREGSIPGTVADRDKFNDFFLPVGERDELQDSAVCVGGAQGRGERDEGGAARLGDGGLGGVHTVLPTAGHELGGPVVKEGTVVLPKKEECGVAIGASQGGRHCEKGGETQALTTTHKRIEQGVYALVQLSTRKRLDASEPSAGLCLRMLGSFQTDAEAKTRVLNLYRCVLPEKPKWLPYQRSVCLASACLSDHLFLLRKGVPTHWLSFDMGTESIVDPIDEREGIGRGYDVDFPAVFKAKEQHFAVALVSSANKVTQDWEQEQKRRESKRDQERLHPNGREVPSDAQAAAAPSTTTAAELVNDSEIEAESEHDSSSQHIPAPTVEDEDANSASGRPDSPRGVKPPSGNLLAEISCGVPEAVTDLSAKLNSGCDASVNNEDMPEVEVLAGGSEVSGESEGHVRDSATNQDDHENGEADHDSDEDASSRGGGGATGSGAVADAAALADALLIDHLLDKSDTESSEGGRRDRSPRGGDYEDGLSHEDTGDGVDGCSEEEDAEQENILSWAVSRMGLVEKVEGCHETEAAAFKKAVEILEKMERVTSGTHITLAPFEEEKPKLPQRQASRRVCVIPLYAWVSLGDGRISGMERAIRNISVCDPSEATRPGVDPFTVWNNQRTRMLRTNLYNLLRAAGSREVRSRCGLDGTAGARRRQRRSAVVSESCRSRGGEGDDVEERAADSARRRQAAKEAVLLARDTVLRQNQKLIQTELGAKRRLAKKLLPPTEDASLSSGPSSICSAISSPRWRGEDRENKQRLGDVNFAESRGRKGVNGGLSVGDSPSATRLGSRNTGREGLRRELRIQMNIERKRARLFEDIRTLPYIASTGRTKSTKDTDGRQAVGKPRLPDHGKSDANTSGIVLRAAVVQAQTRLHGKPASSFFARAHATSATAVLKTTHEDANEDTSANGSYLEREQASTETDPPNAACKSHTSTRLFVGKENQASSLRGSASSASNPGTIGAASFTDASTNSRSEGVKGVCAINTLRGRSTTRRPGTRRQGRGADSWTTSTTAAAGACNLDGELVLLDGILHDPKIKTWVEASLGPGKSARP